MAHLAGGVTVAAGATLAGTANFGGGQEYAYVTGGLTLNGTALLGAADGSTYGRLYFEGTQTLTGTGTATFGTSGANALYAQGNNGNAPATLTVGSGISIGGGTTTVTGYYGNDSIVNDGTITVPAGQGLTVGGANWVNAGTITANGASVGLQGSFTPAALGTFSASGGVVSLQGTLLNAGTTFTLSPAIGTWRWWEGRSAAGRSPAPAARRCR